MVRHRGLDQGWRRAKQMTENVLLAAGRLTLDLNVAVDRGVTALAERRGPEFAQAVKRVMFACKYLHVARQATVVSETVPGSEYVRERLEDVRYMLFMAEARILGITREELETEALELATSIALAYKEPVGSMQ